MGGKADCDIKVCRFIMSKEKRIFYFKVGILLMTLIILLFSTFSYSKPMINDRLVLMWQVQKNVTENDFEFLKNKGVNLIQSFSITRWDEKEIKYYLDRSRDHNIGVIMSIGRIVYTKGPNMQVKFNRDKAKTFIDKWKAHSAVFAWHVFDEPSNEKRFFSSVFQEKIYHDIKEIDPNHPIFLSWNGVQETHYERCFSDRSFDILDVHAYIKEQIDKRQQTQIENLKKHLTDDYPLLFTLRIFVGPKHPKFPLNGLQQQYDFYFKSNHLTNNLGFYGYDLGRNQGIIDNKELMHQFEKMSF